MAKTPPAQIPPVNRLLALLPAREYQRLLSHLQPVTLKLRQVLHEPRVPIEYVYFPTRGVLSAVTVMEDGSTIEVATVGREGMVGLLAFLGAEISPNQVVVQVAGDGLRMKADVLKEEASADSPLLRLLLLYHTAFLIQISQVVACNGLHKVQQRCCRWLLMTQDRVQSDELRLTHEYLATMLGVRRASVTDVLRPLQKQGMVRSSRGKIIILDRAGLMASSCECYRRVEAEFARLFA